MPKALLVPKFQYTRPYGRDLYNIHLPTRIYFNTLARMGETAAAAYPPAVQDFNTLARMGETANLHKLHMPLL